MVKKKTIHYLCILLSVLLSASAERFSVSHMRFFLNVLCVQTFILHTFFVQSTLYTVFICIAEDDQKLKWISAHICMFIDDWPMCRPSGSYAFDGQKFDNIKFLSFFEHSLVSLKLIVSVSTFLKLFCPKNMSCLNV